MSDCDVIAMDRELERQDREATALEAMKVAVEMDIKAALAAGDMNAIVHTTGVNMQPLNPVIRWNASDVVAVAAEDSPEKLARLLGLLLKKGDVDAVAYVDEIAREFADTFVEVAE